MASVTRRVASVLTALVAVLALAACGSSGTSTKDKNAYAEKVNAAQATFASTVTTVEGQSAGKSITQQRRTLRLFGDAIQGVVKDLRAIKAPSEVSQEHQRLISVMTGFGRAIGDASAAMRELTPRGVEQAKRRLAAASQSVNGRVNSAIAAINGKLKGT